MDVIVGIDEVGRGCWAGPLLAAAVVIPDEFVGSDMLRDSKKMTKKKLESADKLIRLQALSFGIGWVSAQEIDNLGLTKSTSQAMQRAIDQITIHYDQIIIDGNYNYLIDNQKATTLIKADDSIVAVSAASIIAKVARDNFMIDQEKLFPGYGFDNHVGYGTKLHTQALTKLGITPLHRRSYKPIQKFL